MRGLLLAALALQARAELTISTFAGAPADRRQIDGPAAVAQFERTAGIVSGGGGNFYLSDVRTIRKISPDGSVSTAAGRGAFSGSRTGQGAFVFVEPHHYLACGGGYVFFASGCIIQRLEIATGLVIEYAGVGCGFQDGASAYFSNPRGMVVAPDGTLYIADHSNHVIRKVTTDRVTSTLAGLPLNAGYADGNGTNARFNAPTDVTIDNDGNLYVADYGNARIRKISPGGLVFTFAGGGICPRQDGNGPDACFGSVLGLTVDASGNLYVADTDTFPPKTFIRKITPAADVTTIGETPSGYVHGTIAFHDGFLHLAILDESRVVRMNLSGTVSHFTGTSPPVAGLVNGPRTTARFNLPAGIDSDSGGSLFISETGNDDVRKIDATGLVSTFASGFDDPSDVAVDASGNVYVSDTNNHVIWRITPAGAASVFAGSVGMPGYQEGTGTSARFNMPAGIHVSGTTVHVADAGNRVIRRINSLRETTLVAGLPGVAGTSDGPGFNARFNATRDVVADSSGNLFVSDGFAIRSVDTMGNVSTFAGKGAEGGTNDGTGGAARFSGTQGISVDSEGNLWVVDGQTIRKVTPAAAVTTEAGSASGLANGTGPSARFAAPRGICATSAGMFVGDASNHVIRQGVTALGDRATIDQPQGPIGVTRQLGTTTGTATAWEWSIIRRPANSAATLSATAERQPTFTPDVPDLYRFRLVASNFSGVSVSEVELRAVAAAPVITRVTPHFGPVHRATTLRIRGSNFHPNASVSIGGLPHTVAYVSSEEVRIEWPPGSPGADTLGIMVTNPDTQNASAFHRFVRGPWGGTGRGDFNADGREELFWRNVATGENGLWSMSGTTPSQIAQGSILPPVPTDWTPAAFADFDADGTSDVLWRNYHTGQNAIWFMTNLTVSQGIYIESVDDPLWYVAGAGDVNGDGFADIIWRHDSANNPATGVWFMTGGNRTGALVLPTSPTSGSPGDDQIVAVRDFNGDALVDLLWRNPNTSAQWVWLLSASGSSEVTLPTTPARPRFAHDFDGDGDTDVMFESPNAVWIMNGVAIAAGHYLPSVPAAMQMTGTARIGNDPRAALLWRNLTTGENACWYVSGGNATGAYLEPVIDPNWDLIGPR